MPLEELLLGFDAREMWLELDSDWDQARRDEFLLRTDVEKPLSTDTSVWPSVLGEPKNKDVAWGTVLHLWDSLETLQEHLNVNWNGESKPYWITGITLLPVGLTKEEQEEFWDFAPLVPAVFDESWSFLGYDISDNSLLSGLSNCGYEADTVQSLRQQWGPHLNNYHLLTKRNQAVKFKNITNARVPEHAPFFVYGLYRKL